MCVALCKAFSPEYFPKAKQLSNKITFQSKITTASAALIRQRKVAGFTIAPVNIFIHQFDVSQCADGPHHLSDAQRAFCATDAL